MTTIKEFEEIKKKIWWELRVAGQKKTPEAQNEYINESQLCMLVGALQLPRPTCDSCKYLLDDKIHDYECNAWGKSGQAISEMAGNYLSDPDDNNRIDFGCIHHSEYEEVKNGR